MITKRQVLSYVRNRDAMSEAEVKELFSPANIATTMRLLNDLKQDIDAQFIACEARLADMRAAAARGMRDDPDKPIRIQLGTDANDNPVYEEHPPEIAEDLFKAKELRWQVRTKRFGYLIESAIADAEEYLSEINDTRVQTLLAAIDKHKGELEGEAGSEDEDLYTVAEAIRSRTAG